MIRIRIGQGWRREAGEPIDSFALELDGMNLVSGANEERLGQLVPAWVSAIHRLWVQGWSWVQVSLPEAHLEISIERLNDEEARLGVVSLGRPARWLRPEVTVELRALREATLRCAVEWMEQMPPRSPRRKLEQETAALRSKPLSKLPGDWRRSGFGFTVVAPAGSDRWELVLADPEDRLAAYQEPRRGGLRPLLGEGRLSFVAEEGRSTDGARGAVYLDLLELLRQADATSEGSDGALLEWGGVRLAPPSLREAVVGLYRLGRSFVTTASAHNPSLRRNPYLAQLETRCSEGLRRWKDPTAGAEDRAPLAAGSTRARGARPGAKARPLAKAGQVRKLTFGPRWERQTASGSEGRGCLLLGPRGPIFAGPEVATAFDETGELVFRRTASLGVACSTEGAVLAAFEDRMLAYLERGGSARWLRDHDGIPVGPRLERHGHTWIAELSGHGVAAFAVETGRELWRLVPPRSRHCQLSVQGERVLVGSDSGFLYGADISDGQVRFRIRSPLPLSHPTVPWGDRFLATLGRGAETLLFAAAADSGNVLWTRELSLRNASKPLGLKERVYLAAFDEGEAALMSFGAKGKLSWERPLPLASAPLQLQATPKGILVSDRAGGACLVSSSGKVQWVVGATGQPLRRTVLPKLARGVLALCGERVRAVELASGDILAEVEGGQSLLDLAMDAQLNLYLLEEDGLLRALRLASHLAVVDAG